LTVGLDSAHGRAGRGPAATWPYAMPLWGLDQTFVRGWLAVERYDVIDLGGGTHRAQRTDLRAGSATGTLSP
jgi:endonuclease/exonuclease/phosphatase (EEP) superfamily protein YafD